MNLAPLRALTLSLNVSAHGVDATVTRPTPDDTPIETRVIWVTPATDDFPGSGEFARRDQTRVIALPRSAVPTVPRGTRIVAAEVGSEVAATWKVDATLSVTPEQTRVVVVEDVL